MAVKDSTLQKLKRIMREEKTTSLDQTITTLMERARGVPKSMFGADRKEKITLTSKEHEEFQESHSV